MMKNPNFLLGMKHGSITVQPTNSTRLTHVLELISIHVMSWVR